MRGLAFDPTLSRWTPRLCRLEDSPALEQLIQMSVHRLQAHWYSEAQRNAALGLVFGVDRQLIEDKSFYVVQFGEQLLGCGGWSRRKSLFGGDKARAAPDPELNPATDPARVRAFFVHPDWARRGIARSLLGACETALIHAGFRRAELVATLAGEPFYSRCGYRSIERYEVQLSDDLRLPVIRMEKAFAYGQ
jgi:GNAT superfamily N-acetyltransferase